MADIQEMTREELEEYASELERGIEKATELLEESNRTTEEVTEDVRELLSAIPSIELYEPELDDEMNRIHEIIEDSKQSE